MFSFVSSLAIISSWPTRWFYFSCRVLPSSWIVRALPQPSMSASSAPTDGFDPDTRPAGVPHGQRAARALGPGWGRGHTHTLSLVLEARLSRGPGFGDGGRFLLLIGRGPWRGRGGSGLAVPSLRGARKRLWQLFRPRGCVWGQGCWWLPSALLGFAPHQTAQPPAVGLGTAVRVPVLPSRAVSRERAFSPSVFSEFFLFCVDVILEASWPDV